MQGNIAQAERRRGVGGTDGVFARAKEEKEIKRDHVSQSMAGGGFTGLGKEHDEGEDGNGNGLHASRWGIGFGVRPQLALKTEINGIVGVKTGIWGPHTEECLRNGA